jgi:hypothetical protein
VLSFHTVRQQSFLLSVQVVGFFCVFWWPLVGSALLLLLACVIMVAGGDTKISVPPDVAIVTDIVLFLSGVSGFVFCIL